MSSLKPAAQPNRKPRWRRRVFILGLSGAALAGSAYAMRVFKSEHRQFSKLSPWYTGKPGSSDWAQLDAQYVFDPEPSVQAQAISLLADQAFVAPSPSGLKQLLSDPPPLNNKRRPYLVRGLQVTRYLHAPKAFVSPDGELWIRTQAVSRWPLPMLERPVVVLLESAPTKVYVDAEVLEFAPSDSGAITDG